MAKQKPNPTDQNQHDQSAAGCQMNMCVPQFARRNISPDMEPCGGMWRWIHQIDLAFAPLQTRCLLLASVSCMDFVGSNGPSFLGISFKAGPSSGRILFCCHCGNRSENHSSIHVVDMQAQWNSLFFFAANARYKTHPNMGGR